MKDLENKFKQIFLIVDNFSNLFINELRTKQLIYDSRKRIKPGRLDDNEVITIIIYFHLKYYSDFDRDYIYSYFGTYS
jgi:hypothetical protein